MDYFEIESDNNPILSASTIKSLAGYYHLFGTFEGFTPREHKETQSTFIGSWVHKAIETQGECLKKLTHRGLWALPDRPEKPNIPLTPDLVKMLALIADGEDYIKAYYAVKDNKTTAAVTPTELELGTGEGYETLEKYALKEYDKVKSYIDEYKDYLNRVTEYEQELNMHIKRFERYVVIDDQEFRKTMSAEEIYNAIHDCYEVFESLFFDVDEIKFEEIYLWNIHGMDGKSMLDIQYRKGDVWYYMDVKTFDGDSGRNYKQFQYYIPMSLYCHVSGIQNAQIMWIDTKNKRGYIEKIANRELILAEKGAWVHPFAVYNQHGELNCLTDDLRNLSKIGLHHHNLRRWPGWSEIIKQYGEFIKV